MYFNNSLECGMCIVSTLLPNFFLVLILHLVAFFMQNFVSFHFVGFWSEIQKFGLQISCHIISKLIIIIIIIIFVFSRAAPAAYGGSQARGLIRAVATRPTPEPYQIRATSANYTPARGNAGSFTRCDHKLFPALPMERRAHCPSPWIGVGLWLACHRKNVAWLPVVLPQRWCRVCLFCGSICFWSPELPGEPSDGPEAAMLGGSPGHVKRPHALVSWPVAPAETRQPGAPASRRFQPPAILSPSAVKSSQLRPQTPWSRDKRSLLAHLNSWPPESEDNKTAVLCH